MKTAGEIISNLFYHSKKFREKRCLNVLKKLLPPTLSSHINYGFVKEKSFFIVIDNFTLKSEFNFKKDMIKAILQKINKETGLCDEVKNKEIKISVSLRKKETIEPLYIVSYKERAVGNFEINTNDEGLRNIFQEIKTIIRN